MVPLTVFSSTRIRSICAMASSCRVVFTSTPHPISTAAASPASLASFSVSVSLAGFEKKLDPKLIMVRPSPRTDDPLVGVSPVLNIRPLNPSSPCFTCVVREGRLRATGGVARSYSIAACSHKLN